MADPDKIDGVPGMMKSFDTDKGSPNMAQFTTNDPKNTFKSAMEEGQAFVTVDNKATEDLTKFVQSVAFRFRADTNTAHTYGQEYETADKDAADKLHNVVFGGIYAPITQNPVI